MRYFYTAIQTRSNSVDQEISLLEKRFKEAIDCLIKVQSVTEDQTVVFNSYNELKDIIADMAAALIGRKVTIGETSVGVNTISSEFKSSNLKCKCGTELTPVPGIHRCPNCKSICTVVVGKSLGDGESNLILAFCAPEEK